MACRISSAAVGPEATVRSAPHSSASRSASARVSTAITRAAVVALRICTPTCPSPPTPITTAVLPGASFGQERRMAWYGVSPASVSGAA